MLQNITSHVESGTWPFWLPQLPMAHVRCQHTLRHGLNSFPLRVILTPGSMCHVLGPHCSFIVNGTGHSTGTLIHGFMATAQVVMRVPSDAIVCLMAVLTATSSLTGAAALSYSQEDSKWPTTAKASRHPTPSVKLIPPSIGYAGCSGAQMEHRAEKSSRKMLCCYSIHYSPFSAADLPPAVICFTHATPSPPPPSSHIIHQKQFPMNSQQSLNQAQGVL